MISRTAYSFMVLFVTGVTSASYADNIDSDMGKMAMHNMQHSMNDQRISLGLPPQMQQHQLANMRSHLEAVREIIELITKKEFENASNTAHSKLGLTEEMKRMCGMFDNDDFKNMGLSFHKSADTLGDVLLTKDVNKSLDALQTTMGHCVQCHTTFRQ